MARAPALQEIEALPEADRLEGYPHPRETTRIEGHDDAQARFAEALGAGRLHHAWLIAGREGIGKATLAYAMARYALATPGERQAAGAGLEVPKASTAARQVLALSHPGLLVLRRPWDHKAKRHTASITVDEVRRLRTFLGHAAGPQSWRVVIVDRADELNINAANALLKSLEEPPPRAIFLLVSSEPGRLLTTIRSRCRRLDLHSLSPEAVRRAATAALAAAEAKPPGDAEWPQLLALAQGSVRRLLVLAGSNGLALHAKTVGLVSLLPKVDWPLVHGLADEVTGPGAEQRFEQFFDAFSDLLARLIRARAAGVGTPDELRLAERMIPSGGLASWAELWETVNARKAETLALNLDRKSLILETFARLQGASRGPG